MNKRQRKKLNKPNIKDVFKIISKLSKRVPNGVLVDPSGTPLKI